MFLFWGLPLSQPSLTAAQILLLLVAVLDASAVSVNIAAGGCEVPQCRVPFLHRWLLRGFANMMNLTYADRREAATKQGEIGTCGSRKVVRFHPTSSTLLDSRPCWAHAPAAARYTATMPRWEATLLCPQPPPFMTSLASRAERGMRFASGT